MTLEELSKRSASIKSISLALIFMIKMFSSQIFSLPKFDFIFLQETHSSPNKLVMGNGMESKIICSHGTAKSKVVAIAF